jgi:hypothetical protein
MTFVRVFSGLGLLPDDWTNRADGWLSPRYINKVAWPDGRISGVDRLIGVVPDDETRQDIEQKAAEGMWGFVASANSDRPGTFTAQPWRAAQRAPFTYGTRGFAGFGDVAPDSVPDASGFSPAQWRVINSIVRAPSGYLPQSWNGKALLFSGAIVDYGAAGVPPLISGANTPGVDPLAYAYWQYAAQPTVLTWQRQATDRYVTTMLPTQISMEKAAGVPTTSEDVILKQAQTTGTPSNGAATASSAPPPASQQSSAPPMTADIVSIAPSQMFPTFPGPVPIDVGTGGDVSIDDGSSIPDQASVVGTAPMNPWLIGAAALGALFIFGGGRKDKRRRRR